MSGNGSSLPTDYKSSIPAKVKRKYTNGVSDFIGVQPKDPKPIIYLSGTAGASTWSEADFTKATGCHYRCFSYAYTGPDSPMRANRHMESLMWCLKNNVHVFMDSGAHSFHNFRYRQNSGPFKNLPKSERHVLIDKMMKDFTVNYAAYIRWCYGQKLHYDFYVTFDAVKECARIRAITKELFGLGIYPVPVYHGDQSLDYVRKYIDDGHKIIGVGFSKIGKNSPDAVHRYYDSVMKLTESKGVACHGFAVTGDIMFRFPWYSVDSTTWLKAAAYGKIVDIMPEKQRVALIHVSSRAISGGYGTVEGLSPEVQRYLKDKVEREGFDFDKVRTDLCYRATYNAKIMVDAVEANRRRNLKWKSWTPVI